MWSFRRSGGNGMELASSDAEGAFAGGQSRPPLHSKTIARCKIAEAGR